MTDNIQISKIKKQWSGGKNKSSFTYEGSEWVGWTTFIKVFKDADFRRALRKYYENLKRTNMACFDPIFTEVIESDVEYRDQLTMCKPEEFDALYATLTKKYQDAGYKAVTEERLAKFEAGKSTRLPEGIRK